MGVVRRALPVAELATKRCGFSSCKAIVADCAPVTAIDAELQNAPGPAARDADLHAALASVHVHLRCGYV